VYEFSIFEVDLTESSSTPPWNRSAVVSMIGECMSFSGKMQAEKMPFEHGLGNFSEPH
jgi:hypothetical protein